MGEIKRAISMGCKLCRYAGLLDHVHSIMHAYSFCCLWVKVMQYIFTAILVQCTNF